MTITFRIELRHGRGPKLPANTVPLDSFQQSVEESLRGGDLEAARRAAVYILNRYRSSLWATRTLALVLSDQRRTEEALKQLRLVISVDPLDAEAYGRMAELADASGATADAKKWALRVSDHWSAASGPLMDMPASISVSRLAVLQERSHLWPLAVDSLRRSIAQDASRLDLYLLLARSLYMIRAFADSREVVEALLDGSPDCLEANVIASALARRSGDRIAAEGHLERAYNCDPSGAAIAELLPSPGLAGVELRRSVHMPDLNDVLSQPDEPSLPVLAASVSAPLIESWESEVVEESRPAEPASFGVDGPSEPLVSTLNKGERAWDVRADTELVAHAPESAALDSDLLSGQEEPEEAPFSESEIEAQAEPLEVVHSAESEVGAAEQSLPTEAEYRVPLLGASLSDAMPEDDVDGLQLSSDLEPEAEEDKAAELSVEPELAREPEAAAGPIPEGESVSVGKFEAAQPEPAVESKINSESDELSEDDFREVEPVSELEPVFELEPVSEGEFEVEEAELRIEFETGAEAEEPAADHTQKLESEDEGDLDEVSDMHAGSDEPLSDAVDREAEEMQVPAEVSALTEVAAVDAAADEQPPDGSDTQTEELPTSSSVAEWHAEARASESPAADMSVPGEYSSEPVESPSIQAEEEAVVVAESEYPREATFIPAADLQGDPSGLVTPDLARSEEGPEAEAEAVEDAFQGTEPYDAAGDIETDGLQMLEDGTEEEVVQSDVETEAASVSSEPPFPDFEEWFKQNVLDAVGDVSTPKREAAADSEIREPVTSPDASQVDSAPEALHGPNLADPTPVAEEGSGFNPIDSGEQRVEPLGGMGGVAVSSQEGDQELAVEESESVPEWQPKPEPVKTEGRSLWSLPGFLRRGDPEPVRSKLADLAERAGREPLNNGTRFELALELEDADPAQAVAQYAIIVGSRDPRLVTEVRNRLEALLESSPKVHGLQRLLGDVCMQQGSFERAIECYSQAFDDLRSRQITDKRRAG